MPRYKEVYRLHSRYPYDRHDSDNDDDLSKNDVPFYYKEDESEDKAPFNTKAQKDNLDIPSEPIQENIYKIQPLRPLPTSTTVSGQSGASIHDKSRRRHLTTNQGARPL
jgi:hypothetical protein